MEENKGKIWVPERESEGTDSGEGQDVLGTHRKSASIESNAKAKRSGQKLVLHGVEVVVKSFMPTEV